MIGHICIFFGNIIYACMCWGTTSSEVDKQGWDSKISFNNDDRAVSRLCLRRQSLIGWGDRHIVVDVDFDSIRECFKFDPHKKNCLCAITFSIWNLWCFQVSSFFVRVSSNRLSKFKFEKKCRKNSEISLLSSSVKSSPRTSRSQVCSALTTLFIEAFIEPIDEHQQTHTNLILLGNQPVSGLRQC